MAFVQCTACRGQGFEDCYCRGSGVIEAELAEHVPNPTDAEWDSVRAEERIAWELDTVD